MPEHPAGIVFKKTIEGISCNKHKASFLTGDQILVIEPAMTVRKEDGLVELSLVYRVAKNMEP